MDTPTGLEAARDLLAFIDASPSPFHACATAAERLDAAGFDELAEADAWPAGPGPPLRAPRRQPRGVGHRRRTTPPTSPFRIVGAHTDSPNLRVKPHARRRPRRLPAARRGGLRRGAAQLVARPRPRPVRPRGRAATAPAPPSGSCCVDRPLLRVPQLAIHLDREIIDERACTLNPQQHLSPIWGLGDPTPGGVRRASWPSELGVGAGDVLGVGPHGPRPHARARSPASTTSWSARRGSTTCARRWAGLEALLAVAADGADPRHDPGARAVRPRGDRVDLRPRRGLDPAARRRSSGSSRGLGGGREDLLRALAGSVCCSADMAHATHPNYADRHEPGHQIALNGGPVLKVNSNLRYATDGASAAAFVLACEQAGVPLPALRPPQRPAAAARRSARSPRPSLGIATFDVGAPQLAMHSARELCGADDPARYTAAHGRVPRAGAA